MRLPVILAEDSPAIRNNLIPALAEVANAEVIAVAETAAEAIAAVEVHAATWRLLILDLFLKQGHGLDVLRATAKTRPDQRIFLVTNFATPDIRRRALEVGADAVFDKSTEIDQLFAACQVLAEDAREE
jgi:DNA-binding NarL/FixJ family response regulator